MGDDELEAIAEELLHSLGLLDIEVPGTLHYQSPAVGVTERVMFRSHRDRDGDGFEILGEDGEPTGFVHLDGMPSSVNMRMLTVLALKQAAIPRSTDLLTCYDGSSNARLTLTMEPAAWPGAASKAYYECGHSAPSTHFYDYPSGAQLPGKP